MRRFYLIGFLILVVFDTVGQVGFKLAAEAAGAVRVDPAWLLAILGTQWIYIAALAYFGAFVTWMTLLEHAPVGPAFAASHLEIVAVLVVSVIALGESLAAPQIAGSVLILAGIAVLSSEPP